MTDTHTLHVATTPIALPLTLARVRDLLANEPPGWISLEPRPCLPESDGRILAGKLAGFEPLCRALPAGYDELPLASASLYGARTWLHLIDGQPLSGLPGSCHRWSLDPFPGAEPLPGLQRLTRQVLTWQDRRRFGLPATSALPPILEAEHYLRHGRLLAWRLLDARPEPRP